LFLKNLGTSVINEAKTTTSQPLGKFKINMDKGLIYGFMVFNATYNTISVISWWSVLLVEEAGENHRSVASH